MVFNRFKSLDKESKDKFLKMCLLMFPQYKSASFRNSGNIILISRKGLFRRYKKPFKCIVDDIIDTLSILRWNSSSLTKDLYKKLDKVLETYNRTIIPTEVEEVKAIRDVIEYLFSQFSNTNSLKELYDSYTGFLVNRDGAVLVDDNLSSSFMTTARGGVKMMKKVCTFENMSKEMKKYTVVTSFGLVLSIISTMYLLLNLPIKVKDTAIYHGVISHFPWKVT